MKKILIVTLFALALWQITHSLLTRPVRLGPGVFATKAPVQVNCPENTPTFKNYGAIFTPLALYEIKAKVLSKKRYRLGREARFSPMDLALGWGRMSDEKIIDQINIRQRSRFFFWRTKKNRAPIPRSEIVQHSANTHLIPANEKIKRAILKTRVGEIIKCRGILVRVDYGNWHWKSSMSREDSGSGACEVIWVDSFESINPSDATEGNQITFSL